jgi:hypothetical protein
VRIALVNRYAGARMNQGATTAEKMAEIEGWCLGLTNPKKQIVLATVGAHLMVLARSSDNIGMVQGLIEQFSASGHCRFCELN